MSLARLGRLPEALDIPELAAGEQSIAGPPEGGARPLTKESDGGATYPEDTGSNRD